jgi:hypothetical protein
MHMHLQHDETLHDLTRLALLHSVAETVGINLLYACVIGRPHASMDRPWA